MSKTTNYILELESSGEVYFKEDEKQYVTTDRRKASQCQQNIWTGRSYQRFLGGSWKWVRGQYSSLARTRSIRRKRLSALRQACYRQEKNYPKFFKVAQATEDDNTVGCRLFCGVGFDDAEEHEDNKQI